jgi:ribonuclease P protein component
LSIRYTYQAKDKLKSRKQTQNLFSTGSAITAYPVRILYLLEPLEEGAISNVQIGVSAPTRYFRKAVLRNRVKRLLREAVRLEKNILDSAIAANKRVSIFVLYIDKEVLPQKAIQEKVNQLFNKLAQRIHD